MSQAELARQLGVSFQQIQKYEKGANRVGTGRPGPARASIGRAGRALLQGLEESTARPRNATIRSRYCRTATPCGSRGHFRNFGQTNSLALVELAEKIAAEGK